MFTPISYYLSAMNFFSIYCRRSVIPINQRKFALSRQIFLTIYFLYSEDYYYYSKGKYKINGLIFPSRFTQ